MLPIPIIAKAKAALRLLPYIGIAALAIFALIQWQSAKHWQKRYIGAEKAQSATVAAYTGAQVAAAEMNKAQIEQIEREYAVIAERTEQEYETRIADNRRAVADFVRKQAASKGIAQGTGASSPATVPEEVMSGTETAIIPVTDLEIVADAYAQLDALRSWALSVGKVE